MLTLLPFSVHAEQPWEEAAVSGIRAMNKGDGKSFTKIAHPETKQIMKRVFVMGMRKNPGTDGPSVLADFGVATVDDLESMDIDAFIEKMIVNMHSHAPPDFQIAARSADFRALSSTASPDGYRVTVEMRITFRGAERKDSMFLLAKKSGTEWKYNGSIK